MKRAVGCNVKEHALEVIWCSFIIFDFDENTYKGTNSCMIASSTSISVHQVDPFIFDSTLVCCCASVWGSELLGPCYTKNIIE